MHKLLLNDRRYISLGSWQLEWTFLFFNQSIIITLKKSPIPFKNADIRHIASYYIPGFHMHWPPALLSSVIILYKCTYSSVKLTYRLTNTGTKAKSHFFTVLTLKVTNLTHQGNGLWFGYSKSTAWMEISFDLRSLSNDCSMSIKPCSYPTRCFRRRNLKSCAQIVGRHILLCAILNSQLLGGIPIYCHSQLQEKASWSSSFPSSSLSIKKHTQAYWIFNVLQSHCTNKQNEHREVIHMS